MSVVEVRLMHQTDWTETPEELSGTDHYRIKVDDRLDNAHTILPDALVPQLFSVHPDNLAVRVKALGSLSRVDGSFLFWDLPVQYSSKVQDIPENPFGQLPEITMDDEPHEADVYVDVNGDAITNSAGDPYIPTVKRDEPDELISISRNLPIFDFQLRRAYRRAVNSDVVLLNPPSSIGTVYSAGLCKIKSFNGSIEKTKDDVIYWKARLVLAVRESGWNAKPLDQGYYELSWKYEFDATITDVALSSGDAFVVKGSDKTAFLQAGDTVLVSNTRKNPANANLTNDGVYTVSGLSYSNGENIISVVGAIPNLISEFAPGVIQGPIASRVRARVPIYDDRGQQVQQPVPLDGSGAALPVGSALSTYAVGDHPIYPSLPFSLLGMF